MGGAVEEGVMRVLLVDDSPVDRKVVQLVLGSNTFAGSFHGPSPLPSFIPSFFRTCSSISLPQLPCCNSGTALSRSPPRAFALLCSSHFEPFVETGKEEGQCLACLFFLFLQSVTPSSHVLRPAVSCIVAVFLDFYHHVEFLPE